jgi:hypothetical protein
MYFKEIKNNGKPYEKLLVKSVTAVAAKNEQRKHELIPIKARI